jgi:hypothetical protein
MVRLKGRTASFVLSDAQLIPDIYRAALSIQSLRPRISYYGVNEVSITLLTVSLPTIFRCRRFGAKDFPGS